MRRRQPPVPPSLVGQIQEALEGVDKASATLDAVLAEGAPLLVRRRTRRELRQAFESADELLRRAANLAHPHSYTEWSKWRHRLSQLDTVLQVHLFAEQDDTGVSPLGSIRAIDTGMSGPSIGELQHGQSRPPGTPARYGLDMDTVLTAPPSVRFVSPVDREPGQEAAVIIPMPTVDAGSPADAA